MSHTASQTEFYCGDKDVRKPNLIVLGYIRTHYKPFTRIPVPLLKICESFYSLWKTRTFSADEIKQMHDVQNRQMQLFHCCNLRINHTEICISMQVEAHPDYNFDEDTSRDEDEEFDPDMQRQLHLAMHVAIPESVKYIAGNFAVSFDHQNVCICTWNRLMSPETIFVTNGVIPATFKRQVIPRFNCYADIHQIKYKDDSKTPYCVSQTLTKQFKGHWKIEGIQMEQLRSGKIVTKIFQSGWGIRLQYENRASLCSDFLLSGYPSFLLLDVRYCSYWVTVRVHDIVKQKEPGKAYLTFDKQDLRIWKSPDIEFEFEFDCYDLS